MPLRFNSISNDLPTNTFAWILQEPFQNADEGDMSKDKKHICCSATFVDSLTDSPVGKFTYTLEVKEDSMELLDVDITLLNDELSELEFVSKLENSSDANEYYQVEVVGEDHHVNIETVNRYLVGGELEGTIRKVSLSAFPFELNVFNDMGEFNRMFGFDKEREVGDTGLTVSGFADNFAGCSFDEDVYSIIAGKVKAYKDVRLSTDKEDYDYVIAWLDTALGTLPTAMGREVFDLKELAVGKTIVMNTYIKANLITQ